MKVFLVTKEPYPNGMAATNRIKCYARSIHEGGTECEVLVCGCTELVRGKVRNEEARGVYEGVPFQYIGGTSKDFRPMPIRLIGQFIRLLKTERYLKKNMKPGDVLFLFMGGKVQRMLRFMNVAHKKGAYCVRDLCELPYGTGKETQETIRLRKVTLETQFPRLDGVLSISESLLNLARTYTKPQCKHIKVPIMVDFEKFLLPNKSDNVDIPFIFHSGTLYEQKDGFLGMIEAFGKAIHKVNKPIMFISTGNLNNSNNKEAICNLINQYELKDKVKFTGYLSDQELKDYLSRAALVIINKYDTQQNNYCFSTKLGEYLAASKPVIITSVGEAKNWLQDRDSAFVIEPENTDILSDAIAYLFNNPDEARKIGLKGQKVCRDCFDYRNWSKPLVDFFQQLGK